MEVAIVVSGFLRILVDMIPLLILIITSKNDMMSLINTWSVVFIVRNEWHASTYSESEMLVYGEFTSMVRNKESGDTKRVVSFSLQRKSVVSLRKLHILP